MSVPATDKKATANNILVSTALSLHIFWVLNIIKTANTSFKDTLDFYPKVGPLLGVFLSSLAVLALVFFVLKASGSKISSKSAYWFYVVSVVMFFFMVFPPVLEPLADLLK